MAYGVTTVLGLTRPGVHIRRSWLTCKLLLVLGGTLCVGNWLCRVPACVVAFVGGCDEAGRPTAWPHSHVGMRSSAGQRSSGFGHAGVTNDKSFVPFPSVPAEVL